MSQKIEKGDIVVFKAESHWLSKVIAWLTDSDVSHAAMVYDEAKIIETLAPGVCINAVDESSGDEVYILRLKGRPDTGPLLETAKKYFESHTRYDFPALVLVGGLLLYRKINFTPPMARIIDRILSRSCLILDEYIQKIMGHSDMPMVCSQFVYQVYCDCGGEYIIRLHNASVLTGEQRNGGGEAIRLIDYLDAEESESDIGNIVTDLFDQIQVEQCSDEEMLKELYLTLSDEETSQENTEVLIWKDTSTLKLAKCFLEKVQQLLTETKSDMPLEALFVTPADLVYHSANLEQVGITKIRRLP